MTSARIDSLGPKQKIPGRLSMPPNGKSRRRRRTSAVDSLATANHGASSLTFASAPAHRRRRLGGVGLPRRLVGDQHQAAGTRRSRARGRPAHLGGPSKLGVAAELCAYSALGDPHSAFEAGSEFVASLCATRKSSSVDNERRNDAGNDRDESCSIREPRVLADYDDSEGGDDSCGDCEQGRDERATGVPPGVSVLHDRPPELDFGLVSGS